MTQPLTDIMEFDHVIEVRPDGAIVERPDIYAPSLHDSELDDQSWALLNGFSGQDRYAGPIMHSSEFIGGGMERFIRENPGIYVALVSFCHDDDSPDADIDGGWAVAYRKGGA